MPNYTHSTPVGIDVSITKVQTYLFNGLLKAWGIDASAYCAYGRCYRNQLDKGYTPEYYDGSKEYHEILYDDRYAAISFFGITGDIKVDITNKAQIHIIFMVDLDRLKPNSNPVRRDEEVRKDVQNILTPGAYGYQITGIRMGYDRVFTEYPGSRQDDGMKYRDMHPLHYFRFDLLGSYSLNDC